jgi:hypothetical protein
MNWTAGILAMVLFWIPIIFLLYHFHKRDQEIERKYNETIKEINKRYGINE